MNIKLKIILIVFYFALRMSIIAQDSINLITNILGENHTKKITSMTALGDINNDGYDDFGILKGNALSIEIYFGAGILSNSNKIIFSPPNDLYHIIYNIVGLHDVNNDSFDDFIITGRKDPIFSGGKTYLYLGGEKFDTIPDFSFVENYTQDLLVAQTCGDINGDGYSDFTISDSYNWADEYGRVFVFYGGDTLSNIPDETFKSDSIADFFGKNATIKGDINGDGYNDLIITATENETNAKMYIKLGSAKGIVANRTDTINVSYGTKIKILGDVNNDGYDDFFVNHEYYKNKLYLGSKVFDSTNYIYFDAYDWKLNFGSDFGGIGDINNDGYDDFAINIQNYTNESGDVVGRVNFYLGGSSIDTIPDFTVDGSVQFGIFGNQIGKLGDINGDGYNEFWVLEEYYPNYENALGKAYIYSMKKFIVGLKEDNKTIPKEFKLFQNYPNPFNPTTQISYQIPKDELVTLKVYNSLGEEIKTLVNHHQSKGRYSVTFNAKNLPSGIYIYKLQSGEFSSTKKMLLTK